MIVSDLNCLIHAYNTLSPLNTEAIKWLTARMEDPEPFVLLPAVVFGFIRITTNPRIFEEPFTVSETSAIVSDWLSRPQVRLADTDMTDVRKALELLESAGTAGNLTTDAQIAALAMRLNAEVHTTDTDFARFPALRWLNPLQ
jgi:toxin-antitoxin system PIN domain toxin